MTIPYNFEPLPKMPKWHLLDDAVRSAKFGIDYIPPPPPVESDHAVCTRLIEGFDAEFDKEIERQEIHRIADRHLPTNVDYRLHRAVWALPLTPLVIWLFSYLFSTSH